MNVLSEYLTNSIKISKISIDLNIDVVCHRFRSAKTLYVSQSVNRQRVPIKNLFIASLARQMIGDCLSTLIRMRDCVSAALLINLLRLSVTIPSVQ